MEKIVCNICGKDDFKTTRGLEMHQRNCKGKKEEIEDFTDILQTISEPVIDNNIKSDRELLLDEIKVFINDIKGSKVTKEQAELIMDYYVRLTGKPKMNSTCPSCLSQAFITLKKNIQQYE